MSYVWNRYEFVGCGGDRGHTVYGQVISTSKIHVYMKPKNVAIFGNTIFADIIG